MQRRLLGWCLVVALFATAGCNGGEDRQTITSSTGIVLTSTTTTEPSTTTTLSREDSLRRRVVELLGIRDQLLMNPDPSRLGEWVLPTCQCYEAVLGLQKEFVANGQRTDGLDAEILGVEFTNRDPQLPGFNVVWQLRDVHVLDSAGSVVRTRPSSEPRGIAIDLRQVEGRWLVQALLELALTPHRIGEVTAVGLP
ncbi:MAG: hypothetical protein ACRD0U_13940 [Acidimicrobiales bacterium]